MAEVDVQGDESLEDADELPPPEDLTTAAISELEGAVEELNAVLALLSKQSTNPKSEIRNKSKSQNSKTETGTLRVGFPRYRDTASRLCSPF